MNQLSAMPDLALILFAPWFLILSVLYWMYPRQPRNARRRLFDLASARRGHGYDEEPSHDDRPPSAGVDLAVNRRPRATEDSRAEPQDQGHEQDDSQDHEDGTEPHHGLEEAGLAGEVEVARVQRLEPQVHLHVVRVGERDGEARHHRAGDPESSGQRPDDQEYAPDERGAEQEEREEPAERVVPQVVQTAACLHVLDDQVAEQRPEVAERHRSSGHQSPLSTRQGRLRRSHNSSRSA